MNRTVYTATGFLAESGHTSRRPRGRRLGALLISLFLAMGAVVGTASVAGAYWSSKGTAAGQARTGTLTAPTGVDVQASDFDSVDVDWTAPTGLGPMGYYVTRSVGGATAAACDSSPTALLMTVSCTDNSLRPGAYTYTVVAVAGSWTKASTPSDVVTIVAEKHLAITRQPRTDVPSTGFLGQVLVQLRDANDNNLKIKNVLVSVTIDPATTTLQGGNPRKTTNKGLANFSSLNVTEPGTYTLTFSAPGYSSETSDPFTVGGFARIQAVSGSGQSAEVGTPFDQPVAFRVTDADGKPVPGAPVSFTARAGVEGASGILTGPTTVTTGSDGTARTTVEANDHQGQFAVEAMTGQGGLVRATSTLSNTAPAEQPTSPPTTNPISPGSPTTAPHPTPTGTTASPTPGPSDPSTAPGPTPAPMPSASPTSSTPEPDTAPPSTTTPVPSTGPESTPTINRPSATATDVPNPAEQIPG